MYVFGGITHPSRPENVERTNKLFKIWLKVPTLKEIAFEAVNYCIKQNSLLLQPGVKDLGIPEDFYERFYFSPPYPSDEANPFYWVSPNSGNPPLDVELGWDWDPSSEEEEEREENNEEEENGNENE